MVLIFSEYPYPIPSFRVPVPAPDVEPTDAPLVSVCFNYSWLPYVLGALQQLTLQSTWSGFFDPPDALAMRRGASLVQQFALAYDDLACPVGDVPAPYWEDGNEADDTMPAETQIWYGYVSEGNFIEDIGVFLVSNFLAAAISEKAAILYATNERKIRLSFFNGGGVPGVIKVYANEILAQVVNLTGDTDEVIDVDVLTGYTDEAVEILQILDSVPA